MYSKLYNQFANLAQFSFAIAVAIERLEQRTRLILSVHLVKNINLRPWKTFNIAEANDKTSQKI